MRTRRHILEFITPCFCAGANQAVAEIRAPAIRGQLRWWFRALGGSPADERTVFGGMAGSATASSLSVRVKLINRGPDWQLPDVNQNSADSYVWYFAKVSGKPRGSGPDTAGPRWKPKGVLPPKTSFRLEIQQCRPLHPTLQAQLDLTIRCFLQLGSLGLRITRGLGAFVCKEEPFASTILVELQRVGFRVEPRDAPLPDEKRIAKEIGELVKGTRQAKNWTVSAKKQISTPSPFGTSDPRQTSAVYFRPVRISDQTNDYSLVVFEAPQHRVLEPRSYAESAVGNKPSSLKKPELNQHASTHYRPRPAAE